MINIGALLNHRLRGLEGTSLVIKSSLQAPCTDEVFIIPKHPSSPFLKTSNENNPPVSLDNTFLDAVVVGLILEIFER